MMARVLQNCFIINYIKHINSVPDNLAACSQGNTNIVSEIHTVKMQVITGIGNIEFIQRKVSAAELLPCCVSGSEFWILIIQCPLKSVDKLVPKCLFSEPGRRSRCTMYQRKNLFDECRDQIIVELLFCLHAPLARLHRSFVGTYCCV